MQINKFVSMNEWKSRAENFLLGLIKFNVKIFRSLSLLLTFFPCVFQWVVKGNQSGQYNSSSTIASKIRVLPPLGGPLCVWTHTKGVSVDGVTSTHQYVGCCGRRWRHGSNTCCRMDFYKRPPSLLGPRACLLDARGGSMNSRLTWLVKYSFTPTTASLEAKCFTRAWLGTPLFPFIVLLNFALP
jgi:hypothetical protein